MSKHCNSSDTCNVKEGFVTVPERIVENPSQTIPTGQIFYKMTSPKKQHKDTYTLFFIHGFGNNHETWACQQAKLCKCFTTVAVDWRSVGQSSQTRGIIYDLDVFVDDFHFVINQLGLKNVVLVGQSIGGTMAMRYVVKYPGEIKKLITLGSFPVAVSSTECSPDCPKFPLPPIPDFAFPGFVDLIASDFLAFRTFFIGNAFTEECQDQLVNAKNQAITEGFAPQDIILNSYVVNDGWVLEDISDLIGNINIPTLVTYGGIDQVVPINNSFFLRENIPNSVLFEFPNKGHFPNVTDYKKFNCVVQRFVLKDGISSCNLCPLIN